jgi:hypothetical protein
MIPVGYMAKRVSKKPDWIGAIRVVDIHSVSGCVSKDFADYIGGLNRSTQHSGRTELALKTKAKSLAGVGSVGTLPWLGFGQVQPADRFVG